MAEVNLKVEPRTTGGKNANRRTRAAGSIPGVVYGGGKDAMSIQVDRRKIHLDEPIKNVGTYQVVLEVADGVTATVKVMVSEA